MYTLVTGGLGYIGSHICILLLKEKKTNVIILDNLSNSNLSTLKIVQKISNRNAIFQQIDLLDYKSLKQIFEKYKIDKIIHCAGLKAVAESIEIPLTYYHDNLNMTINLLKLTDIFSIQTFIFSSSATVYGAQSKVFKETDQTGNDITNPYGKSKYMQEEIIKDISNCTNKTKFIILRYFNPIGAHESGLLRENPKNRPNNLMPILLKVVNKEKDFAQLQIYGSDYNTKDGTCERDFIHVMDLAHAHILALKNNNQTNLEILNIGTSHSISVLSLIQTFEKINNIKIPYVFTERRIGDVPKIVSDCSKALSILNFKCEKTIDDMCRDSYRSIN